MKRLATTLALALAAVSLDAHAVGRLADVEIIDRTTGATLETHYYRGEYWVAGTPGSRYVIAIRNQVGERLLAVTAVDGVNVISGDTAGWQQTGYVFAPFQRYEISGWRKSDRDVATFEFTASPNSYAERTGRPANVGVVGVALFRERRPEPAVAMAAPWMAPPAPAADAGAAERRAEAAGTPLLRGLATDSAAQLARPAAPAPKLGTGHGEREASYVEHADFDRASARPSEVIRIRYDSLANLVAMGVVGARPPLPPRPNPFPGSPPAYVPDPPGYSPGGLR
jgi:hypothetical protein